MTISWRRIYAIFQKDVKDLSKNIFVSTTLLMPIVLAIIYGRLEETSIEIHYLVINLAFTAVAAFVQCAIIAEEKEKNTLRGLMLSPATTGEILGGKSLVSFILTIVTVVICAKLTGYEPTNLLIISIAVFVSVLFYIALGTLLGLLSKSVAEASVLILPIMFVFGFGTMFQGLMEKYPLLSVAEYLPNIQLIELAKSVQNGAGLTDVWMYLVVILLWAVGTSILTSVVFKKREMDN